MDISILLPINQRGGGEMDAPPRSSSSALRLNDPRALTAGRRLHRLGALSCSDVIAARRGPPSLPSRHHREETSARPERQEKEGASPWRPGPSRPAGCADEDRDEPLRREDDLAIHPEAGAPRRPGDVSDVLLGQTRGAGPSEPFPGAASPSGEAVCLPGSPAAA